MGQVLEDLEPDRPVAGHHRVVAEGVHEPAVQALVLVCPKRLVPLLERDRDHVRAEPPDRGDLRLWSRLGEHDRAVHAVLTRPPRHALGHVPGARRPDSVLELVRRGERQRVPRAAQLEGADRLEVLELEVDLRRRVFDLEPDERGADDGSGQALPGRFDLGERDHSSTSVPTPCSTACR
jgi:hypothetical protein